MIRTFGVRGVSLLAAFLLSVTAARILGPERAGVFFLVYTILALLATVGRFGADNLALRLLGGDTKTPRTDAVRLLAIATCMGGIASIVGALVILVFAGDAIGILVSVLVASCIFAQSVAVVSGTILRGLGMLASGVFAELGSLPLIASVTLALLEVVLIGGISLSSALIALTIAAWLTVAWSLPLATAMVRRRLSDARRPAPVRAFLALHSRRLLSMMGTSTLAYGMVWAPVFVLSLTAEMTQVSYYSVGLRVANIVALLPTIQISYLAPEFARRFYSGDLKGLNALAGRSAFQVGALTALPLVVLLAFANPIMTLLFGEAYSPASSIMVILSVGVFIVMLLGQVNQLMLICGLESVALALTFSVLVVWATAGVWVAGVAGATGVAWLGAAASVLYAAVSATQLQVRRGIRSFAHI